MEIEKSTKEYVTGYYTEIYHKKGDENYYHREDGPAYIGYNQDGSIRREAYWINNFLHREDGPAAIGYNEDGSIYREEYYINNVELSKEEFDDFLFKLQLKGTPMGDIFK